MNNIQYANAYSEVVEILKYISSEDYNKIPKNKIELFEKKSNCDYTFSYNPLKTLNEQNVSKIAKGIIAILYRDYWATEEQKKEILNKQASDRIKIEEEKKKIYDSSSIFNNREKAKVQEDEKMLINIKKITWYEKIIGFFKKLFKRKV